MRHNINAGDAAWYDTLFHSEGARVNEAQRLLTSFTDPYTGWIAVRGEILSIRERSPWKSSFDLDSLRDLPEFIEFVRQTAVVTATSHARGSVGHSPSSFKEVISSVLGAPEARDAWGAQVASIAAGYREQLQLDYECFKEWVLTHYPTNADLILNGGEKAIRKHFLRSEIGKTRHSHTEGLDDDDFDLI
eukprot:7388624-Prymnesium_polylepis.2